MKKILQYLLIFFRKKLTNQINTQHLKNIFLRQIYKQLELKHPEYINLLNHTKRENEK